MEDIEIAKNAKMKNIKEIAEKININEEYIEQYGKYRAKINLDIFKKLENENTCKFCPYSDICYKKNEDFIELDIPNKLDFLNGGEA